MVFGKSGLNFLRRNRGPPRIRNERQLLSVVQRRLNMTIPDVTLDAIKDELSIMIQQRGLRKVLSNTSFSIRPAGTFHSEKPIHVRIRNSVLSVTRENEILI